MADSPAYRYVPSICRDYNTKTCTRKDCTRPHLCYKYFHPSSYCKSGKECDYSHNIFNPQAKMCLQKAGFNTKAKPGDVKNEYVAALKIKESTSATEGKKMFKNPNVLTFSPHNQWGRPPSPMVPQLCHNYNHGLCNNQATCHLLHMCQGYVEGNCPKSHQTCDFSHDIFDPMVKARLKDCGMNVDQKPKNVLMEYRRLLRVPTRPERGLEAQIRALSAMDVRGPKKPLSKQHRRPQSQERDKPSNPRHGSWSKVATDSDNSDSSVYDEGPEEESKEAKVQKKKRGKRGQGKKKKEKQASSGEAVSGEAIGTSKQKGSSAKTASKESLSQQKSTAKVVKRSLHISIFDEADICLYFLSGKCAYGESCKNHHQLLPYVWQYRTLQQGMKWNFFSRDNVQLLEQSYCNVKTEACSVIVEGQMFSVDFNTMNMIARTSDMSIPVRRLSTDSYVNENKDQLFATKWTWYWESDEGWMPCGQKNIHQNNQVKDVQTKLEEAYQTKPTAELSIKISGFRYIVDFSNMKQKNVQSSTERRLRRRPTFVSPEEVENAARLQELAAQKFKRDSSESVTLPREWKPMGLSEDMKTVDIPPTSRDYATIRDIFLMSMPNTSIILIKRVQNRSLWFMFQMKADKLKREYGPGLTIERRLFHGTSPEAVDPICEQNFDWRLYGSAVGARYGKGAYFAVQASKADGYVKPDEVGLRFMFYARVLVGKTTKGDKMMRRPPKVDEENPNKLFDSCTDDPQNPSLYVLFDKDQYYPEFIICYKASEG